MDIISFFQVPLCHHRQLFYAFSSQLHTDLLNNTKGICKALEGQCGLLRHQTIVHAVPLDCVWLSSETRVHSPLVSLPCAGLGSLAMMDASRMWSGNTCYRSLIVALTASSCLLTPSWTLATLDTPLTNPTLLNGQQLTASPTSVRHPYLPSLLATWIFIGSPTTAQIHPSGSLLYCA